MKREEAETIKREAYEAIIEMCETRANLFPAHSELIIHMVAGDMQEICRLARLGLRVKWPSEEDVNAMAVAICKVNDSEPFAMTYITESGISQPYGERWMHDIPCARAALSALEQQ